MTAARAPLALTDRQDAGDLQRLYAAGVRRLSGQTQNAANALVDYDFSPWVKAGFQPELWGVSYRTDEFERDGFNLGRQAAKLGAKRVMADIEYAAKGTRATRGLLPYVKAVRAGGYTGPVDLTTLGAPSNPLVNDFAVDVQSFLETGGDVYAQAYVNAFPEYLPALCVVYWTRVGVPRDRLNLMIELRSEGGKPRYAGADWLPLLAAAGLGSAVSLFLSYDATPEDLAALAPLLLKPPPTPLELRNQALALLEQAVATPGFRAEGTRIDLARRVLRSTEAQRLLAAQALGGIL
jgi:hypothetical protein